MRLHRCSIAADDFSTVIQEAFAAFDAEDSGELGISEARDIIHAIFHAELGDAKFSHAMLDVRKFADHKCELTLDALNDAIMYVAMEHRLAAVPRVNKGARLQSALPSSASQSVASGEGWDAGVAPKRLPRGLQIPSAIRRRVRSLNLASRSSSTPVVPIQS